MQRANGVEIQHEDTPPPIALDGLTGRRELAPELIGKLKAPLPPEAVSPNPERPGLSVIKVIYMVERLNEVFGLNGWHVANQVVESGKMIVVKATLSIQEYGITIEQYGGNDNSDRGDAYKGACTDALSKCASYLGIGMDVYKGLRDERPQNSANESRTAGNGAPKVAWDRSNGRTTTRTPLSTGLTSKNMVERFASLRRVVGADVYDAALREHGYRDVPASPTLERARHVYRALLEVFRKQYSEARKAVGEPEYGRILTELRFSPKAKLSPEQGIQVFEHIQEALHAKR
jgi:hypothetical protein